MPQVPWAELDHGLQLYAQSAQGSGLRADLELKLRTGITAVLCVVRLPRSAVVKEYLTAYTRPPVDPATLEILQVYRDRLLGAL